MIDFHMTAQKYVLLVEAIAKLIDDDSFAISFQSMGQYRLALLKEIQAKWKEIRETEKS